VKTIGRLGQSAENPDVEIGQPDPNQLAPDTDVEILLLAVAGAIQRLVAERNTLRSRAAAQELELTRFRRQSTLIHESYRRLTSEFVTQFQLIDNAVSDFAREPTEPARAGPVEQKQE
jgi:hypothetical protein